jgi:hypothetical protein
MFHLDNIKIIKVELKETDNGRVDAKIYYNKNDFDFTSLEELDSKKIKADEEATMKVSLVEKDPQSTQQKKFVQFNEGESIFYTMNYKEHVATQFIQSPGDESLKFIDQETIDKQRGILKHLLTKIGSNLLSGSGIMNVSLPINIFDQRSLLEVFAHQCCLSPYFLEKAGQADDPLEKLKMTTAFAISKIHMSVTQLKPFNPIWGETFQAKIGNSDLYMEQSSHHPPVYNFLVSSKLTIAHWTELQGPWASGTPGFNRGQLCNCKD